MDGDWWVNARVAPRWSSDGRSIAYLAPGDRDSTLWLMDPDGSNARQTDVSGVLRVDWYDDGHQVLYTRRATDGPGGIELRAVDLQTGEDALLLDANATELAVAPDRGSVAYNSADGHFSMNRYLLPLEPSDRGGGLPRAAGGAEQITFGEGVWHVHGGAWSPDGARIVYTRDFDSGNLHVIDGYRICWSHRGRSPSGGRLWIDRDQAYVALRANDVATGSCGIRRRRWRAPCRRPPASCLPAITKATSWRSTPRAARTSGTIPPGGLSGAPLPSRICSTASSMC